jgi:hypothetical protein
VSSIRDIANYLQQRVGSLGVPESSIRDIANYVRQAVGSLGVPESTVAVNKHDGKMSLYTWPRS